MNLPPTLAGGRLEAVAGGGADGAGSVPTVALVTVSDSLPPGAPMDGVAQLVAVAGAAGVPIAVDCSGEPLRRALSERPSIVKLNLAEAAATLADPGSGELAAGVGEGAAVALAGELTARTGGTTIITLGLDGAVAATPDGHVVRISPPSVHGRYPVGSGDAFMAGVATAMLRKAPFEDALRLGAAAAAANAQRQGAGLLDLAAVDEFLQSISVAPIAQ